MSDVLRSCDVDDMQAAISREELRRVIKDMQAAISREELRRVIKEGQQLTDEHNRQFAMNLLEAGFHIVPCGWLADNQIIVSQKVYDAIKAAGGE